MADRTSRLAQLDNEQPTKLFAVRVDGKVLAVRRPVDVPAVTLLTALSDWRPFLRLLITDQDALLEAPIKVGHAQHLVDVYRTHYGLCATVEDDRRLFGVLAKNNYLEAVEDDLQDRFGIDLATEWQQRRWRKLLARIDRLMTSRTSYLSEAMAEDDDLADVLLRREDIEDRAVGPGKKPRRSKKNTRPLSEFSADVELLSVIADRLGELGQIMAAQRGAKPRKVAPMPRPETAMQRARERRAQRRHSFTVARVFGYVDEQGRPTGRVPNDGGTPLPS